MKYNFLALLLFLFLPIHAWSDPGIVAIKGYGSLEIDPDMIEISFAVANTTLKQLNEAKVDVEKRSKKIVKSLIKHGLSEDDITSPNFKVNAERSFRGRDCPDSWVPTVERNIEITLKDIKKYGKVLDILVENGITRIISVEPGILDSAAYERKALSIAIKNAKEQAKFLAKGFDAKVGKIHNIGERKYRNNFHLEEVMVAGVRASVENKEDIPYNFNPGKVSIEADIYVEFELKQ